MISIKIFFLSNIFILVSCFIEEISVPKDLQDCYDYHSRRTATIESVGYSIHWLCLQEKVWKIIDHSSFNVTKFERQWIESILTFPRISQRAKRQSGPSHRIRKEYRRLSITERNKYHRAVNLLKQIRFGGGSRYDFIANIHRGDAIPLSHFGPNFMGWHRVYLVVYENALNQVVPGVTLPYFDSSLDHEMEDPTQSVIWSETFLGNGNGVVTSGPFANWKTRAGPLIRNVGMMGELMSKDKINMVLNQTRTQDITYPNGRSGAILEAHSHAVNIWVGGQMSDLNTAPQDPVFFNHLAYIDFIWEQFRIRQTQFGINPSTDYPNVVENAQQKSTSQMGFEDLRNIDGLNTMFTSDIYAYQMSPICFRTNQNCLSSYLRCDAAKSEPRCISRKISEFANDNGVFDSEPFNARGIQNTFQSDSRNDIREWVFLPVEIIYHRPPERMKYNSYPVYQSKVMMDTDIYSPMAYDGLKSVLKTGNPIGYNKCFESMSNYGKVFVESNGLNYYGTYKEFAVIDNRLALSKATTYAAVKSPDTGSTEVKLVAYDSCGRICKSFCRVPGVVNDYKPCNGAIRVTTDNPKMYGRHYGESVSDLWTFPSNGHCPSTADSEYFIKFDCDFKNDWPWKKEEITKSVSTDLAKMPTPKERSTVKTSSSLEVGAVGSSIPGCLLGHRCVVARSCGPCVDGERLPCLKSYTMYAWCRGGRFNIRRCVGRSQFDPVRGQCTVNQHNGIPLM